MNDAAIAAHKAKTMSLAVRFIHWPKNLPWPSLHLTAAVYLRTQTVGHPLSSGALRYTAVMPTESLPTPTPHAPPAHVERHFESTALVRDVVIGMSDGLTVPFALAAGLSGAVNSSHVVVLAGLAEIAAGSIAMGLGGFLAAQGDAEHYASERLREEREIVERTRDEEEEIYEIFEQYGVERSESMPVLEALKRRPQAWVDFMMRFELGLEEPQRNRASRSAITIALSYVVGGLVPLAPYMLGYSLSTALSASVAITLVALLVFGGVKGRLTGAGTLRSAMQTVLIGGLAAAAAYLLARLLSAH
jgi:vacuolar iron transporter family protein